MLKEVTEEELINLHIIEKNDKVFQKLLEKQIPSSTLIPYDISPVFIAKI